MKNKVFLVFIIMLSFLAVFSLYIRATDISVSDDSDKATPAINSDLFVSEDESYELNNYIDGNVFNVSRDFIVSGTSIVNGNLFIASNNTYLKSNITYADVLSKDDEPSIEKINSKATINGNVFVVCSEFIMEPGCEIHGDLFVVAKRVTINKSSIISGNVFVTAEDVVLNGKIEGSVYASAKSFVMNYFGTIHKDLNLAAESTILSSVIRRNVNITSDNLTTDTNFLTYGNMDVTSKSFKFSGIVDGNATINSEEFTIVNVDESGNSVQCSIAGNLEYYTNNEIDNIESFVDGTATHFEYQNAKVEKVSSGFSIKDFILELLTYVVFVFVVAWLFILVNKNYLNKAGEIKVGNTFAALGIGLLAIIAVTILSIILFITNIGTTLGFVLIFAYIFSLFLSTPLFVLDIAKLLKEKINIYLGILLIALAAFVIGKLPYIGGLFGFLFTMIGNGRIIMKLLPQKSQEPAKEQKSEQ